MASNKYALFVFIGSMCSVGFFLRGAGTSKETIANTYYYQLQVQGPGGRHVDVQGAGAVVLPGRVISIHLRNPLVAGVIAIHDHILVAGEPADPPLDLLASSLLGLREGTTVTMTLSRVSTPVTVEVTKVCAPGLIAKLWKCRSLPPDEVTTSLRGCSDFADTRCQQAAHDIQFARGEVALGSFMEFCLVTDAVSCRKLITYLMDTTQTSDRRSGQTFDLIRSLQSYAVYSDDDLPLVAAQSKSPYFQEWASHELMGRMSPKAAAIIFGMIQSGGAEKRALASEFVGGLVSDKAEVRDRFAAAAGGAGVPVPAEITRLLAIRKLGLERRKAVEKSLPTYEVDANAWAVFQNRPDSLVRTKLTVESVGRLNADGYNLLMIGAIGDGFSVLDEFRKNPLLINLANSRGETVLHLLVEQDQYFEIRNLILDCKGILRLQPRDSQGKTPLDWAKERGLDHTAELLTKAIAHEPL